MSWMLKRTISLRWFFLVPTTYFGREIRKIILYYALLTIGLDLTEILLIGPLSFFVFSGVTVSERNVLKGHTGSVMQCTFSNNGKLLASW